MTTHAVAIGHTVAASANDITPGLLGFLVVAVMALALFFLLRSMNKHLRRVRSVHDAGLAPGSDPTSGAVTGARMNGSAGGGASAGGQMSAGGQVGASGAGPASGVPHVHGDAGAIRPPGGKQRSDQGEN